MKIRNVIVLAALTCGSALLVTVTESGIARLIAAVLLVFVLPGYALIRAWFPHRAVPPEGILFTIVLSLALTAIGGIVLHFSPYGLQTASFTAWLTVITLINSAFILLKRRRLTEQLPFQPSIQVRPREFLLIAAAFMLVFAAVAVSREGVRQQPRPGFTQLWITEAEAPDSVRVGVQNEEGRSMSYHIEINGATTLVAADIELAAGETWEAGYTLNGIDDPQIQVLLFLPENLRTPYRTVTLWRTRED